MAPPETLLPHPQAVHRAMPLPHAPAQEVLRPGQHPGLRSLQKAAFSGEGGQRELLQTTKVFAQKLVGESRSGVSEENHWNYFTLTR